MIQPPRDPPSLSPEEALERLRDGNRRFREGRSKMEPPLFRVEFAERPQRPFAIVLGCSDSRTPVELLFDEGLGELFVVRIAGNIVAPSVVGSVEFAGSQFGSRLVVVMGHTRCGAISATLHSIQTGDGPESKNIRAITDRIAPHIQALATGAIAPEHNDVARECMRANVRASVDHLAHGSRLLEDLVLAGRLTVVGAEYELETGQVHFFDAGPQGTDEAARLLVQHRHH
jgi:carbonic anhydrase